MQTTSTLYKKILQDRTHAKEVKAVVAGVEYLHDRLISVSTETCLLGTNGPGIGCAVSRQIDMEFYPNDGKIPDAARIELYVRICGDTIGVSEWIPQGVFYIDTRESDSECGTLKIHGYDSLTAFANEPFLDQASGETGEWPRTMRSVAESIAARLYTTLDSRCVFNDAFQISYPTNYTCWELLQHIAAAHAGNWIITDSGKLRLIGLAEIPEETYNLIDESGNAILIGGDRIYVG